jgi:hypothetical protein
LSNTVSRRSSVAASKPRFTSILRPLVNPTTNPPPWWPAELSPMASILTGGTAVQPAHPLNTRWTREEIRQIVAEFATSGRQSSEFCRSRRSYRPQSPPGHSYRKRNSNSPPAIITPMPPHRKSPLTQLTTSPRTCVAMITTASLPAQRRT